MSNVQNTNALVSSFVANKDVTKIALGKKSKHVKRKSKNVSSPSVDETSVSSPSVDETSVSSPSVDETSVSSPSAHSVAVTQTVNVALIAKSEKYARDLTAQRARFAKLKHFKKNTNAYVVYQMLLDAYQTKDKHVTLLEMMTEAKRVGASRQDRTLASFASERSYVAVNIERAIPSRKNARGELEYRLADI